MDPPHQPKSLTNNLFFLFILLSTNLLTLLLSSTFYSSSTCSLLPTTTFSTSLITTNTTPTNTTPTTTTTTATTMNITGNEDTSPDFTVTDVTDTEDTSRTPAQNLPPEYLEYIHFQRLPLGYNPNFDSEIFYSPVGRTCELFPDELRHYMTYNVNGSCPDDELLAQKLLLKGCEPLPRRRCRPAAQPNYDEPYPLPSSLWTTPPNSSVVWTAYTCKDYSCLINRYLSQFQKDKFA